MSDKQGFDTELPDLSEFSTPVGDRKPVDAKPDPEPLIVAPSVSYEPNCGNCPYWVRLTGDDGICRRHEPQVILHYLLPPKLQGQLPQPVPTQFWPVTGSNRLCGDHPKFKASRKWIEWEAGVSGTPLEDTAGTA